MRKIVQVSTATFKGVDETVDYSTTVCLCDDGTVWALPHDGDSCGKWFKFPPVPQDEGDDDAASE